MRVQPSAHMFAVGPPTSRIVPLNQGWRVISATSRKTDSRERLWTAFPWCVNTPQKAHPPKHPRWLVTENCTCSSAGTGCS